MYRHTSGNPVQASHVSFPSSHDSHHQLGMDVHRNVPAACNTHVASRDVHNQIDNQLTCMSKIENVPPKSTTPSFELSQLSASWCGRQRSRC